MTTPLMTERTVIAAETESTPYTAESLVAADSNFNVSEPNFTPSKEMTERQSGDGFAGRSSIPGSESATFSFRCDLHGDGSGGVPDWADTFFPACGFNRNGDQIFRPISKPPAEGSTPDTLVRTLTLGCYEDGRKQGIRGAMGGFKIMLPVGKPAYVEFTFMGAYIDMIDAALLAPTYPANLPLVFSNSTFSLGGETPCVNQVEIDSGNNLILRECQSASDGTGYRGGLVTNRKIGGTFDPEAALVADDDLYGKWGGGTEQALSIVLADANDTVTIAGPKIQIMNIAPGDRNGIRVDQLTWQANRSAAADDEFSIEFAAT